MKRIVNKKVAAGCGFALTVDPRKMDKEPLLERTYETLSPDSQDTRQPCLSQSAVNSTCTRLRQAQQEWAYWPWLNRPRRRSFTRRRTRPVRAARKLHFAIGVRQTIFLVGRIFKAVLLPDLTDSDARQRPVSGVQGGDRPAWCDRLRQRNEGSYQYHCCDRDDFAASTHNSIDCSYLQSSWRKIAIALIDRQSQNV